MKQWQLTNAGHCLDTKFRSIIIGLCNEKMKWQLYDFENVHWMAWILPGCQRAGWLGRLVDTCRGTPFDWWRHRGSPPGRRRSDFPLRRWRNASYRSLEPIARCSTLQPSGGVYSLTSSLLPNMCSHKRCYDYECWIISSTSVSE